MQIEFFFFFNCSSLKYIGDKYLPESVENSETKLELDLVHGDDLGIVAFQDSKSLESIKVNDQFIENNTFDRCNNLEITSLPTYLPIETNQFGKIL